MSLFDPTNIDCPTFLSSIFLLALSSDAYAFASNEHSNLEEWFCEDNRLICQGQKYTYKMPEINSHGSISLRTVMLDYKVVMCEPFLRGHARKGFTRFLVSHSPTLLDQRNLSKDHRVSRDSDSFEIDERFLAGSVLSFPLRRFSFSVADSPSSDSASTNGDSSLLEPDKSDSLLSTYALPAVALSRPFDTPIDTELPEGDDYTIYLSAEILMRAGLFTRDWARITAQPDYPHVNDLLFRLLYFPSPALNFVLCRLLNAQIHCMGTTF
jgi:peroxin-6